MNVAPRRTFLPTFIEIELPNCELQENILIMSRGKNRVSCDAISTIITYNEYHSTENLYTEF
jgi:hypothetical protein